MSARTTPWFSMWNQPRSTIRTLTHSRPTFGVYLLSTVYALQSLFFYANWWSLGLKFDQSIIITVTVLFSPIYAVLWLYIMGYIYYLTGRMLRGTGEPLYLRTALAWSKVPYSVNLLMWFVLIFANPAYVFIQDSQGPSSVFLNLIALIVGVWSFVLLVQGVREVQQFSIWKALLNVVIAWVISGVFYFLTFSTIRYLYLLY